MDAILASLWKDRRPDGYDVVVVGSGYGGSITAARLGNAAVNPKLPVCILERGQEWPIGQFPDSFGSSSRQLLEPHPQSDGSVAAVRGK